MIHADFQELFNNAPVPLIITDDNGVISFVNKCALQLLKTSPEYLAGTDFIDLLHPTGERSVFSFAAFHGSLDTQFDYLIKLANGQRIYTQINCHIHQHVNDQMYLFSLQAIRTNEQVDHDLKERVKEQLCIINVIDTFFDHPDLGDALTCCLPVICEGIRFPELAAARIRLTDGELFASKNFRETNWTINAQIESTKGKIGILDVVYLSDVPKYNGCTFLFEEERLIQVVSRIIGMLIQKWRVVNAIRESEEMIRKITSQVPGNTYMFEIEESGKPNILFVNRGTDEFNFSNNLEEIYENSEKVLEVWHEDDRALLFEKMKEAYKSQTLISFQYRVIINDTIRWRWLQAIPEKNKNGKLLWYGATRDITPLVDYIASIDQMLFDISHVMRRPISSMLSITSLMNEGETAPEEIKDLAGQLYPVAEEMDKFMKELNQTYEQKRQFNPFNIDLSSLIDRRNSLFNAKK